VRFHREAIVGSLLLLWCLFAGSTHSRAAERPLITFDKYHTLNEIHAYLKRVTERYSHLTRLVEIGKSRGGVPIMAVEICNPDTGRAELKPGFYLDGNIHGGEVVGGEAALHFIQHLLTLYGRASDITTLVDRHAFYVVPIANPDGRAISVDSASQENHRWNIRPTDLDGDGWVDEDPPDDLDRDGRLLRMRVPDPEGQWKISPDDARLMLRREKGETGGTYYQVMSEGLDNDGDGLFNEDRVGGVDLNRNFPANWSSTQFASGPFPLSEPESWALANYITSRPNIAAIHTYHTSGGLILRFPTMFDQDWGYPEADIKDYDTIATEGAAITGYANFANEKQAIVDLMHPGHGVFNDWASKVFGVTAITTELWKHGEGGFRDPDYQEKLMKWNDELLEGKGFVDWYPFDHPQLGKVELGGWDTFAISSPPESMIADEVERITRWTLTFAERLPRVTLLETGANPDPGATGTMRIKATVANVGWMPTATAYAAEMIETAKPVKVELTLENAELVEGSSEHDLGVLPGAREVGPERKNVEWHVKIVDSSQPARAKVTVISEKAGTVSKHIDLSQ
jgi:murein tripeptide amidase MpaA